MTLDFERGLTIAAQAHRGQVDKGGQPYILHPLRVALSLTDPDDRIIALLHDIVEDTAFTLADLQAEGLSETGAQVLALLTHAKAVPYMDYVHNIGTNAQATRIKLADLADNMNLGRLSNPTEKDKARHRRYLEASTYLRGIPGRV